MNTRLEDGARMQVDLDVVPDEDDPHAIVTVRDRRAEITARSRVEANFKLTSESARKWIEEGGREG